VTVSSKGEQSPGRVKVQDCASLPAYMIGVGPNLRVLRPVDSSSVSLTTGMLERPCRARNSHR
jgi:hypothetical protein